MECCSSDTHTNVNTVFAQEMGRACMTFLARGAGNDEDEGWETNG